MESSYTEPARTDRREPDPIVCPSKVYLYLDQNNDIFEPNPYTMCVWGFHEKCAPKSVSSVCSYDMYPRVLKAHPAMNYNCFGCNKKFYEH